MIVDRLKGYDYEWLLEKELEIYPTDKPISRKTIDGWYIHHPEFGIVFRDKNKIKGVNITIPLNRKGWEGLINGDLLESDCDDRYVFKNGKDQEIGLHICHIRKTGDFKAFYKIALTALNDILTNLRKENKNLKVIGLSALCGTRMGIGLFFNKMNCHERSYVSNEHILKKNGRLEVYVFNSQEELDYRIQNNYDYLFRCKMLLTYPKEPSLIWSYIKA
jgi:hypothetical protein